jgi:hypothetical protein
VLFDNRLDNVNQFDDGDLKLRLLWSAIPACRWVARQHLPALDG